MYMIMQSCGKRRYPMNANHPKIFYLLWSFSCACIVPKTLSSPNADILSSLSSARAGNLFLRDVIFFARADITCKHISSDWFFFVWRSSTRRRLHFANQIRTVLLVVALLHGHQCLQSCPVLLFLLWHFSFVKASRSRKSALGSCYSSRCRFLARTGVENMQVGPECTLHRPCPCSKKAKLGMSTIQV